ncbi:MAG: cyclic nucleotide-binding domain-containing protein, partial [Magnetococcales bacterium]|nr:cyclic nucleotide-binding domain-containing protein [Magnetococcales bacterium]
MSATQEALQYILETHIMFSLLPDGDKRFLQTLFEMHTFQAQEVIAEQGETMDGMYYVYSGDVRLKQTLAGKRASLGVLEKDSSFGESSLNNPEEQWPYQVVAETQVVVFRLPTEKLGPSLRSNPGMVSHFKKEASYITLSHRLRGMLGRGKYTAQQFSDILHNIGIKKIKAGAPVFEQGTEDPRLYYIERGEVELTRTPIQGDPLLLETVHAGSLLGESAALDEGENTGKHGHSAICVDEVTVLVIRQAEVEAILAINPALHEDLRIRVKRLKDKEQEEVGVRERAEGLDQRIKLANGVTEEEYISLEGRKTDPRRFPIVKQRQESDCGAACLSMILNHYGKEFSLGQVVELTNLSSEGPTPANIITGGELIGFSCQAFALRFEDLEQVKLPAIIGWEGHHYAVLYRISGKTVHIADPAKGIVRMKRKEFEKGWTQAVVPGVATSPDVGVLIALNPTIKFEQIEPPKRPILHFVGYIWPYKKYFMDALVAALILNLLGLASPLFTQTIVDTVVVHKDASLLNMMLGGMILVAIFKTVTVVAQSMLLAHTTARIDMRLMSEFYRHVLSLPMGFFLTRNKGEILARFGENAKIRAIIAGSTITVVLSTLMMFIYLLMMFGYSSSLTWVALFFIPMYVLITLYFTPKIKAIAQQMFLTNSKSQSYLIESLNGIETLKATANEYMARARWENSFVDNVNKGFEMQKLNLV